MATDIVKYNAKQNKYVIYSSEDFICNTDPGSGPAANIHSILAAADISVGGGWAEQLLTGWGSEWEQTSSSRSSMSSCVWPHKCCCCPAQSPAVCSSHNAKKHTVRHKLVGISSVWLFVRLHKIIRGRKVKWLPGRLEGTCWPDLYWSLSVTVIFLCYTLNSSACCFGLLRTGSWVQPIRPRQSKHHLPQQVPNRR